MGGVPSASAPGADIMGQAPVGREHVRRTAAPGPPGRPARRVMGGRMDEEELGRVRDEAERCLGCGKPTCKDNCPVATPIPEVIELFRSGRELEAGDLLMEANPLALACALSCDTSTQCERHCIRGRRRRSEPVRFSEVERAVALLWLEADAERAAGASADGAEAAGAGIRARVAVVGGGLCALACAIWLARRGEAVTLFSDPVPALPEEARGPYLAWLERLGVELAAPAEAPAAGEGAPAAAGFARVVDCADEDEPGYPARAVARARRMLEVG